MNTERTQAFPEIPSAYAQESLSSVLQLAAKSPVWLVGGDGGRYLLSHVPIVEGSVGVLGLGACGRQGRLVRPTPHLIALKVAGAFDLSLEELVRTTRVLHIREPRQIAMFIARVDHGCSFSEIGDFFDQHHSTVMNAVHVIEERCQTDERLRQQVDAIRTQLRDSGLGAGDAARPNGLS
jgi:hypothetical protein